MYVKEENSNIGNCPKCGSDNLDYDSLEPDGDSVYWECYCRDCDWEGKEYYKLQFTAYWTKKGGDNE